MRNTQARALKLTIDSGFLMILLCLPFLRIVTKFGYLDLSLFSFQIRDSTQDLGFAIDKTGEGCPDLMFLTGCDFFYRFETGSIIFGILYLLTGIFLLLSLMNLIGKTFECPCSIKTSLFEYLYPFSYLSSVLVLHFYTNMFQDDLAEVKGRFNIIYHLGFYLLFTNLILSLLSVFVEPSTKPNASLVEVPLL